MLYYVLIGLCLSLAGVAGLQLMYMFYLDRIDRERKKRLSELEARCLRLQKILAEAQAKIEEQGIALDELEAMRESREEIWADVIEEN